jgi:hypothetical protein
METSAIILIFLLTICLILGISLVIVIQDLFKLEKKLEKSEAENTTFKNALQKEADIVIDDAHKRAMNVVDEANRKALEIVSSGEAYNEEAQQVLKKNLAQITETESEQIKHAGDELLATYQDALKNVKAETDAIIQKVSNDIEKHATAEITAFTATVKTGTLESQKMIQERIDQELTLAKKEVEAYKEAQMKKAEEQMYQLVLLLTEAAIGKGLTIDQHQNLVLDALQEAKAQGVIR